MAQYLPRLGLTPAFPPYTGPYKVGTVDVEIPVADLPSPVEAPDPGITTVQFRIFYPCESPARPPKPVRWLPRPQRALLSAYARFLCADPYSAAAFSYLPNAIYHTVIPVLRDAPLRKAQTASGKWPVMVFSHGLGGTRNSYSHIPGSLASHGLVVIAPEHRDGSAPISYIRTTSRAESSGVNSENSVDKRKPKRTVDYVVLPHRPGKDVEDGRNAQLRIRCWELSLIYQALLKMDDGEEITNLDRPANSASESEPARSLSMFKDALEVDRPGSVIWGGHSFGSTTVVQFVKSAYHGPWAENKSDSLNSTDQVLFAPSKRSDTVRQITPSSPLVLLDPWAMPLRGDSTRWLWDKPLPTYAQSGPGGSNVLVILSEAFFKWDENCRYTKRMLLPDPTSAASAKGIQRGALVFYPIGSAHLSQSDFGVLYPWLTKKLCNAQEPERTLRLNVRAILQMLREQGYEVAQTSRLDREEPEPEDMNVEEKLDRHDWKILAADANVRGWVAVKVGDDALEEGVEGKMDLDRTPSEAVIFKGEMTGEPLESKA